MGLLNIDNEDAKGKLQMFSKYPYQIVTIVMAICIAYLFMGQKNLEVEFREYIKTSNEQLRIIIVENTEVLKDVKKITEK